MAFAEKLPNTDATDLKELSKGDKSLLCAADRFSALFGAINKEIYFSDDDALHVNELLETTPSDQNKSFLAKIQSNSGTFSKMYKRFSNNIELFSISDQKIAMVNNLTKIYNNAKVSEIKSAQTVFNALKKKSYTLQSYADNNVFYYNSNNIRALTTFSDLDISDNDNFDFTCNVGLILPQVYSKSVNAFDLVRVNLGNNNTATYDIPAFSWLMMIENSQVAGNRGARDVSFVITGGVAALEGGGAWAWFEAILGATGIGIEANRSELEKTATGKTVMSTYEVVSALVLAKNGLDIAKNLANLRKAYKQLSTENPKLAANIEDDIVELEKKGDDITKVGRSIAEVKVLLKNSPSWLTANDDFLIKLNNESDDFIKKVDDFYSTTMKNQTPAGFNGGNKTYGGVWFNKLGFPDFEKLGQTIGSKYNFKGAFGNYTTDFVDAREWLRKQPGIDGIKDLGNGSPLLVLIKNEWKKITWHHHEDGVTLLPVFSEIHSSTSHTGGVKTVLMGINKLF